MDCTFLGKVNAHPRDANISLNKADHKYTVIGVDGPFISVTTWVKSHFEKFDADLIISNMMNNERKWNECNKYWGMTPSEIKASWTENGVNASKLGEHIHMSAEAFLNNEGVRYPYTHKDLLNYHWLSIGDSILDLEDQRKKGDEDQNPPIVQHSLTLRDNNLIKEWHNFIMFVEDYPDLIPYRTEWMIYHEEYHISGSIDMIYKYSDGTFAIFDWKRSYNISSENPFKKFSKYEGLEHIPDTNYWHYTFQLNLYKVILEEKYNFPISKMFLVQLHPNFDSYIIHELENVGTLIKQLLRKII